MKKRKKHLLWILSPSLFIYFLPALISTTLGKTALLTIINLPMSGFLSIDTLSLSWQGPQKIEKITYQTEAIDFTCNQILSSSSLFTFLWKPYHMGEMELIKPIIKLSPEKLSFLQKKPQIQTASFFNPEIYLNYIATDPLSFTGKLTIKEGTFSTLNASFEKIESLVEIKRDLSVISFSLDTQAVFGSQEGSLSINSLLENLNGVTLSLKASAKHLPMNGVDELFAFLHPEYSGMIKELFGSFLEMDCKANISKDICEIGIAMTSDNIRADINLASKDSYGTITAPALFQINFPMSLLSFTSPIALPDYIPLALKIESLTFPLKEEGPLLDQIAFVLGISTAPIPLTSELSAILQSKFSSTNLSEDLISSIDIKLNSSAKKPSSVHIEASCLKPLSPFPSLSSTCLLQEVPTALLGIEAQELLGKSIDGSLFLEGTKENLKGSFNLETPLLQIPKTSFSLLDKEFSMQETIATYLLQGNTKATFSLAKLHLDDFKENNTLTLESVIQIDPMSFQGIPIDALTLHLEVDSLSQISLTAKSASISLESTWAFKEKENLILLTKPLSIDYKVHKNSLIHFFPFLKNHPISDHSQIGITISPTRFFLKDTLDKLELQASINVPNFELENASLSKTKLDLIFSAASDSIQFTGHSEGMDSSIRGSFECKGTLSKVREFSSAFISHAEIMLDNFPLDLVEKFGPYKKDLSSLLGKTVNGTIQMDNVKKKESLSFNLHTPFLFLDGALGVQDKNLSLLKPIKIEYRLTPDTYEMIPSSFSLLKETTFKGSITELLMPFTSSMPNLADTFIKAHIENPQIVFKHKVSQEAIGIHALSCFLEKVQKKETLLCKLSAQTAPEGSFSMRAEIDNLFSQDGRINTETSKATIALDATKMPSSILDICLPIEKALFKTLLGSSFEMKGNLSMQNLTGTCSLEMKSPQSSCSLKGVIVSGIFRLQENATAKVQLTPEISHLFLKKEDSSIKSFSAPEPLTIQIDAKKFSVPIHPLSLSNLEASFIRIQPGKIYCESDGGLEKMLKLLKSKKTKSKDLEVWFAPIDLSISHGIIEIERSEILLDKQYDIAFWGPIDIPRNSVNMTLGITADTLKNALGIKGLPKDYMLKLPIKGTLNNVEVSTGSATTKIAALMLWSSKALEKFGGPLGGALNQMIPPPGGDGKNPPPKHPLPWEIGK